MFVHVKSESSHGLCNRKIEIQREINISLLTISKACERKKKDRCQNVKHYTSKPQNAESIYLEKLICEKTSTTSSISGKIKIKNRVLCISTSLQVLGTPAGLLKYLL